MADILTNKDNVQSQSHKNRCLENKWFMAEVKPNKNDRCLEQKYCLRGLRSILMTAKKHKPL